jgi:3-deoxy-7-phosphoheptulonate synthase
MTEQPRIIVVDAPRSEAIRALLVEHGRWVRVLHGSDGTHALLVGEHSSTIPIDDISQWSGVRALYASSSPHPRVDAHASLVDVDGVCIGAGHSVLAAGPCAIESEESIHRLAAHVAKAGARLLRGGAYKPRTSPYTFRGHGERALAWMHDAALAQGLKVCTELTDPADADRVARVAHVIQIGARSMQNGPLLRAAGATQKPVLLKRAPDATVDEWLLAAEALLVAGAPGVVFCERGGRTAEPAVRNALDISAMALIAARGLPLAVDPSHAAGRRDLVCALALAGQAVGASLTLVEVNDKPGEARSDGAQALSLDELDALARKLKIFRSSGPES